MFALAMNEAEALADDELTTELRAIEAECRRLAARRAAVIAEAERRGTFRADGHASVRGWLRTTINAPEATITGWVRAARLIAELPKVGHALHDGLVGEAQVGEVARARGNPRCGDEVVDIAGALLTLAELLPFDEFQAKVRNWVRLSDADGAARQADHDEVQRQAWFVGHDGVLHGQVRGGGPAVAEMLEIWNRYCEAEFVADLEAADHGAVARTDPQRRFDALTAIFRDAATAPASAVGAEPLVNLVVSAGLLEDLLTESATGVRPVRSAAERLDLVCETTTGMPVDARVVLAAALVGRVRRVVTDGSGRVIDLGRRRRLFTGAAREAAQLLQHRCSWPGCVVPVGRCHIDHTQPWAALGPTSPHNAGPMCRRHNMFKERGYRVWRDPDGRWHTYRPDGSEI